MQTKRLITSLVVIIVAFFALGETAYAHLGWVVHQGKHPGENYPLDLTSLLIIFGAIGFIALAFSIERISLPRRFRVMFEKAHRSLPFGIEWRIVSSLAGVLLIANSIAGVFLASNIAFPDGGLAIWSKAAQMVIGLLLVSQISYYLAGVLILAVAVPLAVIAVPMGALVDYLFEFGALAFALVFLGLSSPRLDPLAYNLVGGDSKRFADLPVPILRIGVGLTLVVLAIHEKLLDPNLALTFLDEHPFNFMPYLGFSGFTNLHFAFAAGIGELTLGLLLSIGVATRFVTAVLAVFFTATLIALGPVELIGHFPLFGIAILLLIHGSGGYRISLTSEGSHERLGEPVPEPVSRAA